MTERLTRSPPFDDQIRCSLLLIISSAFKNVYRQIIGYFTEIRNPKKWVLFEKSQSFQAQLTGGVYSVQTAFNALQELLFWEIQGKMKKNRRGSRGCNHAESILQAEAQILVPIDYTFGRFLDGRTASRLLQFSIFRVLSNEDPQ
jgi:hypothetical protein